LRKETEAIVNRKSRSEWLNLINEWVHNEQDRKMLERHLLDGVAFYSLSIEFFLSEEQIKKRVGKAKEQLFKHL
jgi:hypothetical protein